MDNIISGGVFGAGLTASGMYQPAVIMAQLKFENFHMIQVFLTATASSACLVAAAQRLGYIHLKPRSFSSVGLFAPYDGNIIGGFLLGSGMMLAGACPGTVLAQIGVGVSSGFYALEGGAIAAILWSGFLQRTMHCPAPALQNGNGKEAVKKEEVLTVSQGLGVSPSTVLLGFEAVCIAAIFAAASLTTLGPEAKISPIAGGLLICTAQLVSILLRKKLMGISTSFEEVGDWFWGAFKGDSLPRHYNNILFSTGAVAGAFVLAHIFPAVAQVTEVTISPFTASLGGFLMILGSRVAGGCTSGHGISGMSLMSISSFVTIAATFAGGALVGLLMG
ncbi:hypothetical protein B0T25DRAFT_218683 [Lasiosphaeria hispida]|uniref:Sulphur transport domain-containing protein n=1 Tax=Lasiosphaeria hispida TaxID=260671 RepID=A0AAJ0HJ35_9PEZI|nr:hypothetical protein B0T25DRAFT_218683 [Lasiosphaeria hispida]